MDPELQALYYEELLKADLRKLQDEEREFKSYLREGSPGRSGAEIRKCLRIVQAEITAKTKELSEVEWKKYSCGKCPRFFIEDETGRGRCPRDLEVHGHLVLRTKFHGCDFRKNEVKEENK